MGNHHYVCMSVRRQGSYIYIRWLLHACLLVKIACNMIEIYAFLQLHCTTLHTNQVKFTRMVTRLPVVITCDTSQIKLYKPKSQSIKDSKMFLLEDKVNLKEKIAFISVTLHGNKLRIINSL